MLLGPTGGWKFPPSRDTLDRLTGSAEALPSKDIDCELPVGDAPDTPRELTDCAIVVMLDDFHRLVQLQGRELSSAL